VRAVSLYGRGIGLGKAHSLIVARLRRIRQGLYSDFHPSFRVTVLMVPLTNESIPDLIQNRVVFHVQLTAIIYLTPTAYLSLGSWLAPLEHADFPILDNQHSSQ
jgi:hypothetical protein